MLTGFFTTARSLIRPWQDGQLRSAEPGLGPRSRVASGREAPNSAAVAEPRAQRGLGPSAAPRRRRQARPPAPGVRRPGPTAAPRLRERTGKSRSFRLRSSIESSRVREPEPEGHAYTRRHAPFAAAGAAIGSHRWAWAAATGLKPLRKPAGSRSSSRICWTPYR